ncbi:2-keto-3-deoxy-galactonokinase [Euzebyella marina]|uniref:2-keto-3-deoxy-galactonokinase n=1 Tax=Euzebyella marina TaxID=1761453 RepID=A0A3G2L167_9FLAO|nr:2-dehydro-3-deoxygalactonokinase [Euzebyella marina]AYN66008.1 2-keto-3-deoxy-galactonokinase [Euzebyella marina]
MKLPSHFISCDWGTSNFRLLLVDTKSLEVLSQYTSEQGIKKHYKDFKSQLEKSRQEFFQSYLLEKIDTISVPYSSRTPIIASGMLSSSIGMKELPYSKFPVDFDGDGLISVRMEENGKPDLILVSGARTENDVMRGEEIQAIGLSELLSRNEKGILILPGTHSKHIAFNNGRFENFKTYMTGELFEVISRHSILSASLEQSPWDSSFETYFLEGVKKALSNDAMSALFSVRANSLLNDSTGVENFYFLSGLLIGSELSHIADMYEKVYLGATGINAKLYKLALTYILPADYLTCFSSSDMEKSLLAGQLKILKSYV